MEKLIIINAMGFGRCIFSMAKQDFAFDKDWTVAGFLDNRLDIKSPEPDKFPVLGDPLKYQPKYPEVFLCALGEPSLRRKFSTPLREKGARFMTLAPDHHRADQVQVGDGAIFERATIIGADSQIGFSLLMHAFSVVGHDVIAGDYVTIGSFSFIAGNSKIGNDVIIFPHCSILPGVEIGDRARIGAGSVVTKNVPADATVFGNPARVINTRIA